MAFLVRAGALYAVVTIAMTWPLAVRIGSELPVGGDNLYVAWSLAWVAHAALHVPRQLFDGNLFFPIGGGLAFSDPNVSSALLSAPLYYATGNPALLLNVLLLSSFVLCALTACALAREWGATPRVAFACGLFFAFSPLRFSHLDHVQLYPFWWTPLSLLTFDRYLREGRRRYGWLTALGIVLQAYTSVYLAVFQLTALVLLAATAIACGRVRVGWRRTLGDLWPAAVVGLLLCVPLGRTYLEASHTWGVTRSLEENAYYSAAPYALLSTAPGNVIWGWLLGGFLDPAAPWEKCLFPGLVTTLLAVLALGVERRAFTVRYGALLFVLATVLSLGPFVSIAGAKWSLPYAWSFQWLPPLRALRVPARWALLGSLGLSLAASAGAARLPRRMFWPVVLLAVAEAWVSPFPTASVPDGGEAPEVYRFLAASSRGPLVELPLATSTGEGFRLEPRRLYWSTLHWRPTVNGYSGYTPAPYRELARLLDDGRSAEALALLAAWNVTTVVAHLDEMDDAARSAWEMPRGIEGLREIFRDDGTRVFQLFASPLPFVRPPAKVSDVLTLAPRARQSLTLAFDAGAPPTAVPPAEIGWHSGRARWTGPAGATTAGWVRYFCPPVIPSRLPPQPLFLEPPAVAGRYRLELEARCFDLGADVTISAVSSIP
jgi:hypothetical protein